MSFQPVVPVTGYVGWKFLQRTLETQQAAFDNSAPVVRATDYFKENIAKATTAEDLVSDRQLMTVALGAFGLDDDINNRFFIQKVLESDTSDSDSLANRLSDKRYLAMNEAFGLGAGNIPRTGLSLFTDEIVGKFESNQFAQAVGTQNEDMRLALNVSSGLDDIIANNKTENGQWFSILGNAPLRRVFESALGLPSTIARIDIDQQLDNFKERAQSMFGTTDLSEIATEEGKEDLIRLFLIRSEAAQSAAFSNGSAALTLLRSAPSLFPPL